MTTMDLMQSVKSTASGLLCVLVPGEGQFALLGTTMAPGFDFADFEAGNRKHLLARYPAFADEIRRLSK